MPKPIFKAQIFYQPGLKKNQRLFPVRTREWLASAYLLALDSFIASRISLVVAWVLIPGTSKGDLSLFFKVRVKDSPPFLFNFFCSCDIKHLRKALPRFRICINFHNVHSTTKMPILRAIVCIPWSRVIIGQFKLPAHAKKYASYA